MLFFLSVHSHWKDFLGSEAVVIFFEHSYHVSWSVKPKCELLVMRYENRMIQKDTLDNYSKCSSKLAVLEIILCSKPRRTPRVKIWVVCKHDDTFWFDHFQCQINLSPVPSTWGVLHVHAIYRKWSLLLTLKKVANINNKCVVKSHLGCQSRCETDHGLSSILWKAWQSSSL